MKLPNLYAAVAVLLSLSVLAGCGTDKEDDTNPKADFDRGAMLANYADNLIVPGYEALAAEAAAMEAAVAAFAAEPSAATLAAARAAYQEAYKAWQQVSIYEFGPADEQMLRNNLNIYPTAASEIESNISSGNYDLQAAASLDAKGFPALDYLLYSAPSEEEVVALYITDASAANRKQYLQEVAILVSQRADAVYEGWTSGNYTATFEQAAGTAVGSAVGNLVNQLNFDIDLTKRAKVGIPSGRFTAGSALPEKVEAYYSGTSLELLKAAVRAEKAMFMGANGPGLDDYLDHVEAAYNGGPLSAAIEAQFDAALAAAEAVDGPLSEAVATQPEAVAAVYDALQKLIVLTKTDMPAALGVTITYSDNDGD